MSVQHLFIDIYMYVFLVGIDDGLPAGCDRWCFEHRKRTTWHIGCETHRDKERFYKYV